MISRLASARKRGILYSLGIAFNRVVPAWLVRMRYFVVFELDPQPRDEVAAETYLCKIAIEDHQFAEAERLSHFRRSEFSGPVEATVVFREHDAAAIAACWIATRYFDETDLGVRIELSAGRRWLFAAMVDQQFRGQKIFRQLLAFTIEQQTATGATRLFASVNPFNKSSMKVFGEQSRGIVARVFAARMLGVATCIGYGQCRIGKRSTFNCHQRPITIEL